MGSYKQWIGHINRAINRAAWIGQGKAEMRVPCWRGINYISMWDKDVAGQQETEARCNLRAGEPPHLLDQTHSTQVKVPTADRLIFSSSHHGPAVCSVLCAVGSPGCLQ